MMQSKRELWVGHVAAWQSSGLSQTAWCREHGVSLASFGYWRGKLAAEARSALPAVLPIRVGTPAHTAAIELRFPSGVTLSLSAADPTWLASVLRGVGAC